MGSRSIKDFEGELLEGRTVPYPAFLGKMLMREIAGKPSGALIFGDGVTHLLLPNSVNGRFAAAVRKAQATRVEAIAEAKERGEELKLPEFPRVTPHDLRHTAASLAISSGANVKAVQRMLGHASAAMTLDTYADLFDDDLDAVAKNLAEAARTAGEGKPWAAVVSA